MKYGITTFPTDEGIRADDLARAVERRGFESLFVSEHSHIPASRQSPYPAGGELPRRYYRTLDPFVALTAAAAVTERLVVGTGVCLLIQRDPIHTAKEVASLDLLSGGRFVFGIGAGWNREEMADHGTDPARRMTLLRERVLAMKELWTQDEAEYHGSFVDFAPTYFWPKPVQRPYPPVLVGGGGPTVLDRVLGYGDGWFPNPGGGPADSVADKIAELRRRADEKGRAVSVTIFGARPERGEVEQYAELGVERCLFLVPPLPTDDTMRRLDTLASLAGR
ncbi:MAG: LLM class F420-dependent oxidoreductase [Streptosporangiaceae bacterium]